MQDLERYRSAAQNYLALQGLRIIPIGLLFFIFPLQRLNLPVLGSQGNCTLTLPLMLVAILSWFWIGRYYEKTFGKVKLLVENRTAPVAGFIALFAFITGVIVEMVLYRSHLGPPFNLVGAIVAAATLYAGWKTQRWYYTLGSILLGIASFLPLILGTGVDDPIYGEFGVVFTILFGVSIVSVGVLDHLRLVRYFQPKGAAADVRNP